MNFIRAFEIACLIVFIAEMGDKTQIMTLTFSTRYRASVVLLAVLIATVLIHLISVIAGTVLGRALPLFWINLVAGVVFVGFGIWALRGESEDEDEAKFEKATGGYGPLVTV